MLARKKAKSLGGGNSSLNQEASLSSSPFQTTPANNRKTGLGSFNLSSSLASTPSPGLLSSSRGSIKRERDDKGTTSRRGPSLGISQRTEERVLGNNDILGEIIPKLKNNLFCTDVNNIQKTRELKRLLSCLDEWGAINDAVMLKLIEGLKENVDSLDEKMTILVHQILDSNWCSRPTKVVKAFEDFISELIVIKPFYAGTVMQSLIRKFLPQTLGNAQHPNEINNSDQKTFDIAHRNLQKVLEAFPRMKESCVKTMGAAYPYMTKSPYVHYCFVANLLATISYAPQITCQILQLCIHKLCRIDVNIPRHSSELLSRQIKDSVLDEKVKSESGGKIRISLDSERVINTIIFNSEQEINPLVNILDLCMLLVFQAVESLLADNNLLEGLESFYDSMLSTFESEVLPSFGVNHVQFLFFYLASTRSDFNKKFLDFLWMKTTNVNTPSVIRMQCMSYIAGLLSRSTIVSVKILRRWLTKMATWANSYVDQRVKDSHWSSVNVQIHGPFYAVCQTIFYIFAFRNKDLIGSKRCTAFTNTLNLGRLVTCNLNPLKASIEAIQIEFVKAAHTHQISYCQTVLERNQRATIPNSVRDSLTISAMDSLTSCTDSLEAFFPFDPYLLPRSEKWINPTYRTYEAYLPELKIEKQESPNHWSDPSNEDSIDMELSTSYKDKGCSHFMARLMDTSDIKDEPMDD